MKAEKAHLGLQPTVAMAGLGPQEIAQMKALIPQQQAERP